MKTAQCFATIAIGVHLLACTSDATVGTTDLEPIDRSIPQDAATVVDTGTADSGTTVDSGSLSDAATNPDGSTPQITLPLQINGCTTYVDRSATGDMREIIWTYVTTAPAAWCMKIKAGQSVTWKMNAGATFNQHPLAPYNGDTGNPITGTGNLNQVTIPFTIGNKTFGYHCTVAGHTGMVGAIYIVP